MDKMREEFECTGDLLETYNDFGSTDPTWNYVIWLENRLKSRDEEIKKLRDALKEVYKMYAYRLDNFSMKLKKGECDLIYKIAELTRYKESE